MVDLTHDVPDMKKSLEDFLTMFREYRSAVFNKSSLANHEDLRTQLLRSEPKIKGIIIDVLGNSIIERTQFGIRSKVSTYDLFTTALMDSTNLRDYSDPVTSELERAIGTLDAGLRSPKGPEPVLVIHDTELRDRCSPLLEAPQNYDTVIREATTVLEDRIRSRPPHGVLTREIPISGDQTGDNLINKLCNPEHPILSVSNDRTRRIAFRNMLIGVTSYLRNPYHHTIDSRTEWSWAWSTVGLIDRLSEGNRRLQG